MARLLFSPRALASLIRAGDSRQFRLDLKVDREAIIAQASTAAITREISLSAYAEASIRRKKCVSYADFPTHLLLRAISRHLRKRYRVILPSRDRIVRGIIETLMDGTPMFAIRRDITSFYESIPIEPIRDRLLCDTGSSTLIRSYLKDFFRAHCPSSATCGLPRGVGLSALLAEMSMEKFDKRVKALPGVFKYYRFSDDILIFSTRYDSAMDQALVDALPQSMAFNPKKSCVIAYLGKDKGKGQPWSDALDYLGYRFTTTQPKQRDTSRIVRVAVSMRKINRIKTRIILSLIYYRRHVDWPLLRDRCRFVAGNYKVRRQGMNMIKGASHVFSGIYYNYKMCGEYEIRADQQSFSPYDAAELKALDGFYHSILKRKVALGEIALDPGKLDQLRTLSFHRGFTHRIKVRFGGERVALIKQAWRDA